MTNWKIVWKCSEANFGVMQNDENLDIRVVVGNQYIGESDVIIPKR